MNTPVLTATSDQKFPDGILRTLPRFGGGCSPNIKPRRISTKIIYSFTSLGIIFSWNFIRRKHRMVIWYYITKHLAKQYRYRKQCFNRHITLCIIVHINFYLLQKFPLLVRVLLRYTLEIGVIGCWIIKIILRTRIKSVARMEVG